MRHQLDQLGEFLGVVQFANLFILLTERDRDGDLHLQRLLVAQGEAATGVLWHALHAPDDVHVVGGVVELEGEALGEQVEELGGEDAR